MEEENKYNYTYSAKEQAEVKKSGISTVRKRMINWSSFVIWTQVLQKRNDCGINNRHYRMSGLGTGMSCVMVWGGKLFVIGIIIGIVGVAGVIAAYPLYTHITKEKERIAPEIIRISDELLK